MQILIIKNYNAKIDWLIVGKDKSRNEGFVYCPKTDDVMNCFYRSNAPVLQQSVISNKISIISLSVFNIQLKFQLYK